MAETPTYRHTEDMPEISGFGGEYEKCCQDMLEAGVNWLAKHPGAEMEGHTLTNVYGYFSADSDDAKAMEKVVTDAAADQGTGAMHHAVMSRLFWIAKNGWDAYCAELRKRAA